MSRSVTDDDLVSIPVVVAVMSSTSVSKTSLSVREEIFFSKGGAKLDSLFHLSKQDLPPLTDQLEQIVEICRT